jgi:glycerol-3-phosphate dehydrogenase subunit C
MNNRKVAFFTGCFTNYYYPQAGHSMVAVLRNNGFDVIVPPQVCCGLPLITKGNERGARRNCERNVAAFGEALRENYPIITSCPSCRIFLKRYYPLLGGEGAARMAEDTYHFSEHLLHLHQRGDLNTDFKTVPRTFLYKTPCHLRNAGVGHVTIKLLNLIPGLKQAGVSEVCCGMGGPSGLEKKNRKMSLEIAGKMIEDITESPADLLVTDCGSCKLQIEYGTGIQALHPVLLLHDAYRDE